MISDFTTQIYLAGIVFIHQKSTRGLVYLINKSVWFYSRDNWELSQRGYLAIKREPYVLYIINDIKNSDFTSTHNNGRQAGIYVNHRTTSSQILTLVTLYYTLAGY